MEAIGRLLNEFPTLDVKEAFPFKMDFKRRKYSSLTKGFD
jgi:hypothetical protein